MSGLNEGVDPESHKLVVDQGSYKVTLAGGVTVFERDETGQLVALRGPNKRTILERNERGQVIGAHTEREDITPE